ncbi:MAG: hypothetical protein PHN45_00010 [Methylococcales bacterium]|nr:hypothetical protein [Methylococcales bacterium]
MSDSEVVTLLQPAGTVSVGKTYAVQEKKGRMNTGVAIALIVGVGAIAVVGTGIAMYAYNENKKEEERIDIARRYRRTRPPFMNYHNNWLY